MRVEPDSLPLEQFLAAIRSRRAAEAERLFERHPTLAHAELCAACALGEVEFVADRLAADPGAALRPHPPGTWLPLHYVAASPFHARDERTAESLARVAAALVDAGSDPNDAVPCEDGGQTLRLPVLYFACEQGSATVARVLLERGADPNDGESIYHAAQFDRRACLELLLAHGADAGGRHAHWGNTPLFFLLGHIEGGPGTAVADRGIRWLLEHGADPELTSGPLEETALHCAARIGRGQPMLALLLEHGADPSRARADGATPHGLALRYGNTTTAAALAAAGADPSRGSTLDRFLAACHAGDASAARAILAREPGLIESLDPEALGQLGRAAGRGDAGAVRVFLELGFAPGFGGPGADTPLHHAAWNGRPECVRLLLEGGAPVNGRDAQFGCSPLAWACHGSVHCREADADYLVVLDLLVAAGADRASAFNRWGAPPEAMARPAIAARLVERGFAPAVAAGD